jgi:hypothetical protein
MSESNTNNSQSKPEDHMSEEDLAKQRAGDEHKSSHDHMSREKASTNEGAGGGAKQKQNH